MEPIKTLSLWQPWASLVAVGEKRIETRSWATKHRGTIAIHATQNWPQEARYFSLRFPAWDMLAKHEQAFGNYALGRYAWVLSDWIPLEMPIPARGGHRLWNWEGKP